MMVSNQEKIDGATEGFTGSRGRGDEYRSSVNKVSITTTEYINLPSISHSGLCTQREEGERTYDTGSGEKSGSRRMVLSFVWRRGFVARVVEPNTFGA